MINSFKNKIKRASLSLTVLGLLVSSTGCSNQPINAVNNQQQQQAGYTADYTGGSDYGASYGSGYGGYGNEGGYYEGDVNINTNNLPTGTVTGRISDTLTNMGVPNATIEVMGIRPAITTVTDASGNFTLPNVPQGRQVITVNKERYTTLAGNSNIVINVAAGNTVTANTIMLIPERAAVANGFIKAFDGFTHPRGVTIDKANEEVYVVDVIGIGGFFSYDRAEVKKINTDGGVVDTFGSRVASINFKSLDLFRFLRRATGIGIDDGGNIYVADTGNDVVKKYGPTGNYVGKIENEMKDVLDVAVLASGDIVVADTGNARVSILDSSMNVKIDNILDIGSDAIRGVTIDSADNIYVLDGGAQAGQVVKKYDKNGNKLPLEFGIIGGLEDGYFNNPTDLEVDARNGDIYVVDTGNNRVQRFSKEGNFKSQFGQFGSENGFFNAPWGIAIDNEGFIYISDSKNGRVQKFMPGGFGETTF